MASKYCMVKLGAIYVGEKIMIDISPQLTDSKAFKFRLEDPSKWTIKEADIGRSNFRGEGLCFDIIRRRLAGSASLSIDDENNHKKNSSPLSLDAKPAKVPVWTPGKWTTTKTISHAKKQVLSV